MANLRELLYTDAVVVAVPQLQEFLVARIDGNPANGGCCCVWTVPAGATYIRFELWGGGGGGAGSCCCMQGYAGGSGSYTVKTLQGAEVVPGCQYTICAGGSTTQGQSNDGCSGCHSYVTGHNLSNLCARGGQGGYTSCCQFANCYVCQMCYYYCCSTGGDYNIHTARGGRIASQYCHQQSQQWATVAASTVSGPIIGPNGCTCSWCGQDTMPRPVFPGGGGMSSQNFGGGCRRGYWVSPGAVSVTFG